MPLSADRPWLRRDTSYAETQSGVQVTNASAGFELLGRDVYRLFRAVHPLLDGSRSAGELRTDLGPDRWEKVMTLIRPLSEQGFLRWIPDADRETLTPEERRDFSDQVAFLAQYTDEPHAAFRRFRTAQVHVLGSGPFAASVRENLLTNGLESIASTDTGTLRPAADAHIVVTPTAEAMHWLASHRWEPWQGSVLPVLPDGDILWALPHHWVRHTENLTTPPDWIDGVSSLTEGGGLSELESHWQRASVGRVMLDPYPATEAVQRMFGVLIAYELFKGLTGALPPETAGGAIAFDCRSGQASSHPVHPHPWRGTATFRSIVESASAVSSSTVMTSRAEEYPRWATLVGSPTLPIKEFTDDDLLQLPLKLGAVRDHAGRVVVGASLWTTADARLAAIAEIYQTRVASLETNEHSVELAGVARKQVVPAASVLRLSSQNAAGTFPRNCANIGLGLDLDEAIAQARQRATVEHLVLQSAIDGLASPLTWSDHSVAAEFLRDLAQPLTTLHLLDLGQVEGLHGVAVIEKGPDGETRWQAAAAPEATLAATEALVGLHGARQAAVDEQATTPSMRSWPHVDPDQLNRQEAASRIRDTAWLGVIEVKSPELASVGLSASAARVLTNPSS